MRAAHAASVALLLTLPAAARQPSVDDLLAAGRKYVETYKQQVSGILLDERYTIIDASTGRMDVPGRLGSDLVLLQVDGKAMSLRDAYSVNGAKIRDQEPRLPALLGTTDQTNWNQAQRYAQESQRHFMAEIVLYLNDPLSALNFMAPADPSKFTYSIEGRKKIDGVEVLGLRFVEKTGDNIRYALGTRYNAEASGKFWIEPATGVIRQTELYAESKYESGRTIVTYALAKDLNIWLPSKSTGSYQERDGGPAITGMSAGGVARTARIEANASYSNPRRTAIGPTKIAR